MNLLLDTQIFIWFALEPHKLTSKIRTALANPSNILFFSIASVWEMQIKASLGKLTLPSPVENFVQSQRKLNSVEPLAVIEPYIWSLAHLPLHHRDPFDRLLIAQAIHEQLTLITVDPYFVHYPVRILT
jgi:PIN domain nuclease of toxin-antitoxin system